MKDKRSDRVRFRGRKVVNKTALVNLVLNSENSGSGPMSEIRLREIAFLTLEGLIRLEEVPLNENDIALITSMIVGATEITEAEAVLFVETLNTRVYGKQTPE